MKSMFLKRLFNWFFGGKDPSAAKTETYPDRREATEREAEEPSRVSYRELADGSDARAAALHIDPPRAGRKTYAERHSETSAMSTDDIRAKIAEREAQGKECGVLYRVLADRGE